MITLKTIRERVRGGKVDPLSKMGKSKLTGQEITQYYRDNPDQKKAARDKDVKKAIEIALDMGGAMKVAMREIEKFKRGLTKNPAVKKALQHANESVQEAKNLDLKFRNSSEAEKAYKVINNKIYPSGNNPFDIEPPDGSYIYFDNVEDEKEVLKQLKKGGLKFTVEARGYGKKPVSMMTPDEKKKDAERRKAYNAFQKKNRKEENGAGDFGTTKLRKKYEEDTPKSVNEEMPRHLQQISKMFKTKNATEIKGIDKLVVMSSMSTVMDMQKQNPRGFKKMVAAIGKLKEGAELDEAMESVIKENGMLNENVIEKMREIVSKKQAMKVSGVMVDMFTASAVVQIYDKVNDANKKKMEKMKPAQLANVAMKIMQKQSVSEGNLFREYEPGEFRNGEEKMYVDIIKKNGGKNIKVAKPDRREPNLSINFKGGNVSKMRQDLDKVDDGLTDIDEAVSPAQQAAIAISKKERGEKPKKENRARRDAMRGMASDDDFRFKKSDDIPTASADDRKAADKNPIIQLRRIADLPKGGEMEFKDGKKSKVSQTDAKKALKGFMMMKKGNDKAKFQDNVGRSLKDLKKILRIIK